MRRNIQLLIITTLALLMCVNYSYPGIDDGRDRLSNDQAGIFSPGYINAAKQKTDAIIRQLSRPKSKKIEEATDDLKENINGKVKEGSAQKVTPELKKKTGAVSGRSETAAVAAPAEAVYYNVSIGSGADKVYEGGRLISEVIDGKRHVYAGFENVGKAGIQDAINLARAGEIVIVKAGTYNSTITLKDGVSLYGGYNESGIRDLIDTPTILNPTTGQGGLIAQGVKGTSLLSPTTVDGFTISSQAALFSCSNVTLSNNTFTYTGTRINNLFQRGATILLTGSFALVKNNQFSTSDFGVFMYDTGNPNTSGVQSLNNNYLNGIGIGVNELEQVVSSNNDYFSQRNIIGNLGSISIINTRTAPNAANSNLSALLVNNSSSSLSSNNSLDSTYAIKDETALYSSVFLNLTSNITESRLGDNAVSSVFKNLLANRDSLASGSIDPKLVTRIAEDALARNGLALPQGIEGNQEMDLAMALAGILKNPTDDQKLILDAVQSLMLETEKAMDQGASPELKKTTDDLMQMVAAVLVAQAIPDLLKEGDIASIKNIFSDMNQEKVAILLEYQNLTKPYYDEIKKLLAKNMAILQSNDIISKEMIEKELANLEPREVDRILEKIRNMKNKSADIQAVLDQEAKSRKEFIDPNQKMLEDKMKLMMQAFTQRIAKALEDSGATKKK